VVAASIKNEASFQALMDSIVYKLVKSGAPA